MNGNKKTGFACEDWHVHSNFSTCAVPEATIEAIIQTARERRMRKVAVVDHVYHAQSIEGDGWKYRDPGEILSHLRAQKEKRDRLLRDDQLEVKIGVEIDMRRDGIDYVADKVLEESEVVTASLHHVPGTAIRWHHHYGPEEYRILEQAVKKFGRMELIGRVMELYCKAAEDERIDIIGHPFKELGISTLVNKTSPIPEQDLNVFFRRLIKSKICFEVNSCILGIGTEESRGFVMNYGNYVKMAQAAGCLLVTATDSHSPKTIGQMGAAFDWIRGK